MELLLLLYLPLILFWLVCCCRYFMDVVFVEAIQIGDMCLRERESCCSKYKIMLEREREREREREKIEHNVKLFSQ